MTTNYRVPEKLKEQLKRDSISSQEEICGFILRDKFIKVENKHPESKNFFLIDPLDCIWEEGVILFHSHPDHVKEKGFSEWDLENQYYFQLDMLLYSVNNDEFYFKKI